MQHEQNDRVFSISKADLEGLTIKDMGLLYDGVWAAIEAAQGVLNRPCAMRETIKDGHEFPEHTPGAKALNEAVEYLHCLAMDIVNAAERIEPKTKDEAADRACLLLTYALECETGTEALVGAIRIATDGFGYRFPAAAD